MTAELALPAVAAECHGVKVPDSPMMTPERARRINAARYEGQEIAGALEVIRPGDRVLELGAGLGLVGAIAAMNGAPEKVLSFEANPNLIPHINALYALNGLQDRISVRNEVLISAPDRPDTMTFHIRNSYLGSSLIDSDTRATTAVDVPTADYAQIHRDFAPTVLLMDIEGGELDFLRHASLDGVRAVVIEFHPGAYGKEGMRECKSVLEKAGFAKVPEHCTRQVWTCTFDPDQQPPRPTDGWSEEISLAENAIVVPPSDSGLVQAAGVLTETGDYAPRGALWRNGRALTTRPPRPDSPNALPLRKGTWLWGGVLWVHFGHFLVESTARLWALEQARAEYGQIDGILYIPKRARNGDEVRGFHRDFAGMLAPDLPVACAGAPERVERLILPGQGFGLGPMITGTQAFRTAMLTRFAPNIAAEGPEKLYISRSGLPSGRGNLIGEEALEQHLAAQGYTIYHPERHDLAHQVATYRAARQVIAAEGSALHLLAMVADPAAQVAIVVRRPSKATANLEQHLRAFAGIAPSTLTCLTRSWKPKGPAKPRLWKGELDLPALRKALISDGFLPRNTKSWPKLDATTVQSYLGDDFVEATGKARQD